MIDLETTLIDHGVTTEDIDKAKAYRSRAGGALEKILLSMGSFSEELLPSVYAQLTGAELLSSEKRDSWQGPPSQNPVPFEFFLDNGWLLYDIDNKDTLIFATYQPLNWNINQHLVHDNISHRLIIVSEADFSVLALKVGSGQDDINENEFFSELEEERLREMASEAPTVNLLNSLITRALRMQASDMHLEPKDNRYRVRFRIDGVLHDIDMLPKRLELPVISRLKILSGMDIAEKRRPQDGKIETRIANIDLDVRVSSLPVNQGESMVLRFLRKDTLKYDLTSLGLSPDVYQKIKQDLAKTSGVILLTGPTGAERRQLYTRFLMI